jgi:glucose-6-phosphate-specific signal transduction histidine kinase
MSFRTGGVGQLGPWFRHRRRLAIWVGAGFGAAIGAMGLLAPGDRTALFAVLALPTALLAVTFGTKGGIAAGVAAAVVCGGWVAVHSGDDLGIGMWAGAGPLLVLGALLGQAVDGLDASEKEARKAEEIRFSLERAADHRREAVEINDTLVQSAAIAKWALEAGDVERALAILEETVDTGQRLVTALINGGPPAGDQVESEPRGLSTR